MIRERARIIEYIARRLCARKNDCEINSPFANEYWYLYGPEAEEALKAVTDYDSMRAAA
jgi:hypothetical protein